MSLISSITLLVVSAGLACALVTVEAQGPSLKQPLPSSGKSSGAAAKLAAAMATRPGRAAGASPRVAIHWLPLMPDGSVRMVADQSHPPPLSLAGLPVVHDPWRLWMRSEWKDYNGHHVTVEIPRQNAVEVLDMVFRFTSDKSANLSLIFSEIRDLAGKFAARGSFPIHFASPDLCRLTIPACSIDPAPLRTLLNVLCQATGLEWSLDARGVMIDRPPPMPMSVD